MSTTHPPFRIGVTHYPEHTARANWEPDLDLMAAHGFNFIRQLDISWTKVEPCDGVYTFEWLDDYLDLCHRKGFTVVMCTPTASPPPWLVTAYPEVQIVQADGSPFPYGARRQVSVISAVYRTLSARIAEVLAKRYGNHPAVIGWQVDNELHGIEDFNMSGHCEEHSAEATERFREWLQARYTTVEALNLAWGNGYWSCEYSDWKEITTPRQPRCINGWFMDFYRFYSDMNGEYLRLQAQVLRRHISARQWITHNFTSVLNKGLDVPAYCHDLDLVSWDPYPYGGGLGEYIGCAMKHDLMRTVKRKPFWAIETYPGESVPQACLAEMVANGAAAVAYWPWRKFHYAQESWHSAFVDYAGEPYPYIKTVAAFSKRPEIQEPLPESLPPRSAAYLYSQDTIRCELRDHPHDRKEPSLKSLELLYRAKWNIGVATDFVSSDDVTDVGIFAPYKLLFAPGIRVVRPELIAALTEWVNAGGILLTTGKFASLDTSGKYHTPNVNEPAAELVGYTVRDEEWVHNQKLHLTTGEEFVSEVWVEHGKPTTGKVLGAFVGGDWNGRWDGRPAVIENRVGKGMVISLLATSLMLNRHFVKIASDAAGIPYIDHAHEEVAVLPHLIHVGRYWYFNYAEEPRTVGNVTIPARDFVFV